jgi:cell division transport system permease protein
MVSSLAIAVSLFIISVTYCLYISFQDLTLEFKDRYSIEVFFDENISEKQAISEFNSILSSTDQIEEGFFIDKADAANIFKTQFDEDILEILGENPLPFSAIYTISESYRDYNSMQKIIKDIELLASVDVALYEKDAIIEFDKLIRNIMIFIFAITFFVVLVVIFFVSNTILLVIYSKKEDIQTYQLLGAPHWFIKIPYLLEGMIHGLIGAMVSLLLLFLLYNLIHYFLSPFLDISNYDFITIVLLNFLLGMFLGFLGSSKALSSYVKD